MKLDDSFILSTDNQSIVVNKLRSSFTFTTTKVYTQTFETVYCQWSESAICLQIHSLRTWIKHEKYLTEQTESVRRKKQKSKRWTEIQNRMMRSLKSHKSLGDWRHPNVTDSESINRWNKHEQMQIKHA